VKDWEHVDVDPYSMGNWGDSSKLNGHTALNSFLSVGGFIYFDAASNICGVTTLGRFVPQDSGPLVFDAPKRWLPRWTAALAEQGRFQRITMRVPLASGAKLQCWLRPKEVLESCDGEPLPTQPDVPCGGFVYLFHENPMETDEMSTALDRYFPVVADNPRAQTVPQVYTGGALFRPFSVVDEDSYNIKHLVPQSFVSVREEVDEEESNFPKFQSCEVEESSDEGSIEMATPIPTPRASLRLRAHSEPQAFVFSSPEKDPEKASEFKRANSHK